MSRIWLKHVRHLPARCFLQRVRQIVVIRCSLHLLFKNRRHFPHIAIGLYLATASLFVLKNLDYIFVMIEPRLARSLKRAGLHFEQMGGVIEYHGQRAPFFITPEMLNDHLKPDLKKLYLQVIQQVKKELQSSQLPNAIAS